ncbi:MAG TPA: alpha-D-ribose 1-methylphosphonate 5-triphosphate diphosphatase, partial [Candidatus Acidoferrum sp.]|nr:alpha-D-ribose 1-methylphosphonate 5-triphosphate diphosphatase [Candidatus Acidoferrum sp.]
PGMIELHTDSLERHFVPRPGVRWPEIAAVISHDAAVAAAGITTVLDAVALGDTKDNSDRTRELDAMVRSVKTARLQGLLRSEHFLHLRCEVCYPDVLSLFTCFNKDPLVRLVSLMDHTPGQRQFTHMEKFLQYYKGRYTLNDDEIEDLVRSRKECQEKYSQTYREQILGICRQRSLPVASHDDTTSQHVEEAAAAGIVISEFPTTLQAARAARAAGLVILMGAPNLVLGRSHSGNVSALELARAGLLDILSSDYVPSSLLHGAFLLHHELGWSLPEALGVVSANPARVARLEDRGCIEAGKRADLIHVKNHEHAPIIKGAWRNGRRIC